MESELFSERLGSKGPHVVILHGWGHSIEQIKPLGELLAHRAQVHLIDLPGFGRSKVPEGVWSSFDYADRIVAYLKVQGIDKAHLIGHSFGGKVAMSMASRYPAHVDTLGLLAAAGLRRKRTAKDFLRLKWIIAAGTILKTVDNMCGTSHFENVIVRRYGSADYRNAGAMRAILVKSVNEDLSEHIAKIVAPALLLWGADDVDTPPEMGRRLNMLIKGSRLCVFPGKNHHLHRDGGAALCAAYILDFIGEKGAEDGTPA